MKKHEAIESLNAEIAVRRSELATLERARDITERRLSRYPGRCDYHSDESPCYGRVYVRHCLDCGHAIHCCVEHGGSRASHHALAVHRADECAGPGSASDEG